MVFPAAASPMTAIRTRFSRVEVARLRPRIAEKLLGLKIFSVPTLFVATVPVSPLPLAVAAPVPWLRIESLRLNDSANRLLLLGLSSVGLS